MLQALSAQLLLLVSVEHLFSRELTSAQQVLTAQQQF